MPDFNEGVRPGGLTTSSEVRVLLCYLLDNAPAPVSRAQIEEVLLGEELVNYFSLAEGLSQLCAQGMVLRKGGRYTLTEEGKTAGRALERSVPRSVRDAAVRGVIRAQQHAAKAAAHQCEISPIPNSGGRLVRCGIGDGAGPLFKLELYMPDELAAEAVKKRFINAGDETYKLVLAALTGNRALAEKALAALEAPE